MTDLAKLTEIAEAIGYIRARGGRTGKKIHWGGAGSSTLRCGHWMKWEARHFRTDDEVNCERCIAAAEADLKRTADREES